MSSSVQNNVLIFRKYLLAYSETFIADQGRYLDRYSAIYAGFNRVDSGFALLEGMGSYMLENFSRNIQLEKLKYRMGLVNKKWLDSIVKTQPAIVHAHFLNDGVDSLTLCRKLDVPLITTLHGHDITKVEKTSVFKVSRKTFFSRVNKVIAVSDYIYQHALQSGCPENKLVKHSIGIDLEKFSFEKQESEQPELLFVGRLVEKKGCIYLLEAIRLLSDQYPELKLTIVGDGPLKAVLQEEVARHSLNVDFVGKEPASSIRQRLSKAWVFVAPSITAKNGDAEGLGMVFLEAQALQTPVVSFASGGVVEAIADGQTGLLSEEKDVHGLCESIRYFLDNEKIRREFGKKGRQRVEQYFDIRKQCLLLEDIYDSVR